MNNNAKNPASVQIDPAHTVFTGKSFYNQSLE